jgi:hypothetical protein
MAFLLYCNPDGDVSQTMNEKLYSVAEKVGQLADHTVGHVSRRDFLGKLGTVALSLTATIGGLLAMPQTALAAAKKAKCCKGGHCASPGAGCILLTNCFDFGGNGVTCIWSCNGTQLISACHK